MACPQTELSDRRTIHALRPQPIRQGIKSRPTPEIRLFGVSDWVWGTAAILAAVCWVASIVQGL